MKKMKRVLSLLLALVLVLGYVPVKAEAYDETSSAGFTFHVSDMILNGEVVSADPRSYFNYLDVWPVENKPGQYQYVYTCFIEKHDDQNVFVNLVNDSIRGTFTWNDCQENLKVVQVGGNHVHKNYKVSAAGSVEQNYSWTITITRNKLGSHDWKSHTKVAATCTTAGVECEACANCAKTRNEKNIGTNNVHNYTWTNDGTNHTGVCTYNSRHTVTGKCEGGTATCVARAKCSTCNREYGENPGHNWGKWEYDNRYGISTTHYRFCSVCNPGKEQNHQNPVGFEIQLHSYTGETCVKKGTCVCGYAGGDYGEHSMSYTKNGDVLEQICANSSAHKASVTMELDSAVSRVYTGNEIKALKVVTTGTWEGQVPAITYSNNVESGTAKGSITVDGKTIEKTFTIEKAPMPDTIEAKDFEGVYDGENHSIEITGVPAGSTITYKRSENGAYSAAVVNRKDVGTTTVWYKVENKNYEAKTGTAQIKINAANMGLTVSGYTGTYDGLAHGITIQDMPADSKVYYKDSESGEYAENEIKLTNVGEKTVYYKVTNPNYNDVEGSAKITITAADMAVTVTGYDKPYDGQEHGITITGAPENAKITYRVSANDSYREEPFAYKNAGTDVTVYYKVEAPNYDTVEGSAKVVITKREVTVKAVDKIIEYGDPALGTEDLTYQFNGIVQGENPTEVLGGGPLLTCGYEQNDNAGEYTIAVDISNMKPAEVTPSNYTVKAQNGKLTVEPRELDIQWSDLEFIYDGESHKPTATVTNAVGEDEITLSVTGGKTNANTESTPKHTATIEGFTVKGGSKSNYELPETVTKEFVIKPAAQEKPVELEVTKESILGKKDGRITGVDSTMEYRKDGTENYTKVSGTEITGLTAGKYFVRVAAKTNYAASEDVEVVLEAEKSLKVTVPATQEGYTLTADKTEYGYNDDPVLTLTVAEGYTKTEAFKVKAGETELTPGTDGKYTISDIKADVTVTVEGIADVTKPVVKLILDKGTEATTDDVVSTTMMDKASVKFEEWWGIGTTITPMDTTGSGSQVTYKYYESAVAMSEDDLGDLNENDWNSCTGPIRPDGDGDKIFYFKAVDKDGNESDGYVSTKGFKYDGTRPSLSLGDDPDALDDVFAFAITRRVSVEDANLASIEINGESKEIRGSDGKERTKITYRITKKPDKTGSDSTESYVFEVADKAGNISKVTYTITDMDFVKDKIGTSWSQGSNKTLDFTVNAVLGNYADVDEFDMEFQVKIGTKVIEAKNYTLEETADGTVIKLKPEYLKTLKAGKYEITVSVVDNTQKTLDSTETVKFSVTNNPKTGDSMNLTFWGGMAVLSLMAAAMLVLGKKRIAK